MLPLLVVVGVIGAVVSAVQGGSWLSDQIDSSSNGGKASATPATEATASPFSAAIAAQVAGQTVPVSAPAPANAPVSVPASASVPVLHGPDQDALARMKAGMVAYNHVGEHRNHHPKPVQGAGDNIQVAQS